MYKGSFTHVYTLTVVSSTQGHRHLVRSLALGHLDPRIGGAGGQTSIIPVTRQPALPPKLSQTGMATDYYLLIDYLL